jgi:hypothetical protein
LTCVRLLSIFLVVPCIVLAQRSDTLTVQTGNEAFQAGWLHRVMFGDLWRDTWRASARLSRGPGSVDATASSVNDTTGALLPSPLRSVLSPEAKADFLAAYHPFASTIASLLEDTIDPVRAAGRPLAVQRDTIDMDSLLARLRTGSEDRVDVGAYLRLRLLDWFLGNDIEDASAWKWVAEAGARDRRWFPTRHDLSRAFARFDGLFSFVMPLFLDKLPSIDRPSFGGEPRGTLRALDRRILPAAEWTLWDSVSAVMVARCTESVIASAVESTPSDVPTHSKRDLATSLRRRRDCLNEAAREWYERMSETVDIFGSDAGDVVQMVWTGGDRLRVLVQGKGHITFDRSFDRDVTSEIRIHALGDDDLILLRGEGGRGFRIVIFGGEGDDEILDERTGRDLATVRLYDASTTRIAGRSAIHAINGAADPSGMSLLASVREDRGTSVTPGLMFDVNSDVGVLLGAGPVWTRYGLFDDPYASRISVVAGYSPFVNAGKLIVESDFHGLLPGVSTFFRARASGVERVRFFGFGNDGALAKSASDDYYRVTQTQYRAEAGIRTPTKDGLVISLGGSMAFSSTHFNGARLIDVVKPFGVGAIADAAVFGRLLYDTRDFPFMPSEGSSVHIAVELHPAWLDLPEGYRKAIVDLQTYLPFEDPVEGTLGLREHGEAVWGRFPYYGAAFLGGAETLRGYYDGRFAGDAAFALGSELRITAGTVNFVMPTNVGVMGFAETGQVYTRALGGGRWHASFGGGVWAAPALKDLTMTLRIGFSQESTILFFDAAVGM